MYSVIVKVFEWAEAIVPDPFILSNVVIVIRDNETDRWLDGWMEINL